MTPRTTTASLIAEALASDDLMACEIAQKIGIARLGVDSALRAMWVRGEVTRFGSKGNPFRYRLKGSVTA
jgi:GTP-sensing pleiotropic transcriptional regulator CodY